jgi:hypothetical protein
LIPSIFCSNITVATQLQDSANLAQSVEQRIRNAQVAGSNPAVGSMNKKPQGEMALWFFMHEQARHLI